MSDTKHCGKIGPSNYGGYGVMVCTAPADHDGPCYAAKQAPRPVRMTRPTSTGEPREDEQ